MDRLDAIEVLLAVVDAGSLSAAGRQLNAPLTSVSRKVAELERHLGTQLLIRTSRNVQLTDAGRDYAEAMRQLVAQMKEAEARASGEYQVPRGELRITTPIEFGRRLILPLVYDFLREHPDISINVLAIDRFVDLSDERIDVGLRLGHLSDSSLYALKLGDFRLVTCASPDYLERKGTPRTPFDLSDHDAVEFNHVNFNWSFPCDGRMCDVRPKIRFSANTLPAACAAAVEGLGIVRTPTWMIRDEIHSGALLEILEDYAPDPFPVHFVYVKQGLLPLKVRVFLDWMTPRMRQGLKEARRVCDRLRAKKAREPRADPISA